MLNSQKLWTLKASVNGKNVTALIDSGATVSVVAKEFVPEFLLYPEESIPIQVASGQTLFTLGTTDLVVELDSTIFKQKAQVLDTSAFDAILGLDFLSGNPRCGGVLTQPPPERLIFDQKFFELGQMSSARQKCNQIFHVHKLYKSEAYTLTTTVKEKALQKLEIDRNFFCDLFANQANAQEKLYCTRQNSAFKYNWSKLSQMGKEILWANPPFSQLERVITKVVHNPCKIVLVSPNWPGRPWKRILDKIALCQFFVPPGEPLYETDRDKNPLPAPLWETTVSLVDTTKCNVNEIECDPNTLKWVTKTCKDLGPEDLKSRVAKYPWTKEVPEMDFLTPDEQKPEKKTVSRPEMCQKETQTRVEEWRREIPSQTLEDLPSPNPDMVWAQVQTDLNDFLLELVGEVEINDFSEFLQETPEIQKTKPKPKNPKEQLALWLNDEPEVEEAPPPLCLAKPTGKFPISKSQVEDLAQVLHQKDFEMQKTMVQAKENPFQLESTNIQGEFEADLAKIHCSPQIKELIWKYKEVFGPLPPHKSGEGCKLVEMDIELKDEFKTLPLRTKCWPMPPQDCAEIEAQVDELVNAGLLEPFPPGEFPKYCSPTFLVDKKESKTRRMVGKYVKLNKRSKSHVGWLPNMEALVENMAKTKYKSKLDLRSGFWQVGLTPRAQELSAITTPNGRCFRWLCMPFGLQGAPGVFQEMIEYSVPK